MLDIIENMDPPKNCLSCRFGKNESIPLEVAVVCSLNGEWALDKECKTKPEWCPFKEVD